MSSASLATLQHALLVSVRSRTIQLFDLATSEEVLHREPMLGFRPLLWHLAHIGVFQNYWVLQRAAAQPSMNPQYDVHFDPIKTPREEAKHLPSRAEIESYLARTLSRVEDFLAHTMPEDTAPGAGPNGEISAGYAVELVLEHERQHQETIAFLLQALPHESKKPGPAPINGRRRSKPAEISVPSSRVEIGGHGSHFVYDNELPRHSVDVAAFFIDCDLTTNAEYAEFVEAGGYSQREFWSEDGWKWKESAGVSHPMYWSGPPWQEKGFFASVPLRDDAPVSGISWYEAEAYARYRKKRLPTEFEWETAAAYDPARNAMRLFPWGDRAADGVANAEAVSWGTTPVGQFALGDSGLGLHDAAGNLWEWTSSDFRGYPGFAAYPYREYSELWFDGDHRVSRGGSWFSAASLLRASFRNFYRRHFRAAFLGLRCARDAR